MPSQHDALSRTLSLVSHELATPLSVAAGYLRMLLREQAGPINDKQRKMLEEADTACGRIAALVGELKEFRRLLSNELTLARDKFDFAALVAEVASGMHEGRDRGVTLQVIGADAPLEVVGDRAHLGRAVGTLLHASLRERGDPGVITAELSRVNGSPPAAQLVVGDEETRRALQVDSSAAYDEWHGGQGLARPLARMVVLAHGGTIWSTPKPDRDRERPGWSAGSALRIPLKG
jgi:signal transduction histidine kinase